MNSLKRSAQYLRNFNILQYQNSLPKILSCQFPSLNVISIRLASKKFPEQELGDISQDAIKQKTKGKIYDKKPFKYFCEKGKVYWWCACGQSKSQPFCDATHLNQFLKITLRPVRFDPPESKEYWFCNCKQTNKRPFCDGTHKAAEIQETVRS